MINFFQKPSYELAAIQWTLQVRIGLTTQGYDQLFLKAKLRAYGNSVDPPVGIGLTT